MGSGQVGHRRFLYGDVEALGKRLGRIIPPEPDWSAQSDWNLSMLAEYLGLSTRFLTNVGIATTGMQFTWEQVQDIERTIYGSVSRDHIETEDDEMQENEHPMEDHGYQRGASAHCGPGHQPPFGPGFMGFGPHRDPRRDPRMKPGRRGAMQALRPMQDWIDMDQLDATNLLALKRALRHLEAQKLDLEDVIAELKKKIEMHPDYDGE